MSVPDHIAIIMDGNRRWARAKNKPDIMGHRAGVKSVDSITEACAEKGVKVLTLYGFSTENWNRGEEAVGNLFGLLEESLKQYIKKINSNNVRLNVIGEIDELPESLRKNLLWGMDVTSENTGLVLNLALNYGGRSEIVEAVKEICHEVLDGSRDIDSIDEDLISGYLYTKDIPDPDLMIRTSGEMRISNFLLWQLAYAEFYVTETYWPDFGYEELEKALEEYARRTRRFGG